MFGAEENLKKNVENTEKFKIKTKTSLWSLRGTVVRVLRWPCSPRVAGLILCTSSHSDEITVNVQNIRTPQKIVVITLKFELCGPTIE